MHSVNSDWDPNYTVFKKKNQKSGENSQGDFFIIFKRIYFLFKI